MKFKADAITLLEEGYLKGHGLKYRTDISDIIKKKIIKDSIDTTWTYALFEKYSQNSEHIIESYLVNVINTVVFESGNQITNLEDQIKDFDKILSYEPQDLTLETEEGKLFFERDIMQPLEKLLIKQKTQSKAPLNSFVKKIKFLRECCDLQYHIIRDYVDKNDTYAKEWDIFEVARGGWSEEVLNE